MAGNRNVNVGRGPAVESMPLPQVNPKPSMIDYASIPTQPKPNQFPRGPQPKPRQVPVQKPQQPIQKPPGVYQGFPNQPDQRMRGQDDALNWQKNRIGQMPQAQRTCQYCDRPPAQNINGLCTICYDIKNGPAQTNHPKCGNPDKPSCNNLVYDPNEFMCQECINEQRAGLEQQM